MNENNICDTVDFASNISAIEQEEYEQAAIKAQATANRSGKYRQTIMNEIYANASAIKSYRFFYKGDDVVVANGSVVRKLISYYPVGDREINGKRMKVSVNAVWLDLSANKAVAQCVPPTDLVRQGMGTPCDDFAGINFEVPFDEFALKLPVEWLADFLYRTPYEALPGNHIGKLLATLYRFTDLKDANRKTNL